MILDKDEKPLSSEEENEFMDDVWDAGIPMSEKSALELLNKWGERLGIPKPELNEQV